MVLLLCVEESHPRVLVRRIVWPLANQVGPRTVSQALQRALPHSIPHQPQPRTGPVATKM